MYLKNVQKQMLIALTAVLFALMLPAFSLISNAQQIETIVPQNGYATFTGQVGPNAPVTLKCSINKETGVNNRYYSYGINGVFIPGGSTLSVTASPVETLKVSGGMFGLSIVKDGSVSGNTGTFSMGGIPEGTYDVTVYGISNGSKVSLYFEATYKATADSTGHYTMTVRTSGLPSGVYKVTANGVHVANAYLGVAPPATPTPTPTPAPTATNGPFTPSVTPVPDQGNGTASNIVTATPGPTAPAITPTPEPTVTPSEEPRLNPVETQTESTVPQIFLFILLIIFLLSAAIIVVFLMFKNNL